MEGGLQLIFLLVFVGLTYGGITETCINCIGLVSKKLNQMSKKLSLGFICDKLQIRKELSNS